MKFINKMLVSDNDYELKFKNDIGNRGEGMAYYAPSFFTECFPAKIIDTIEKAQEVFEEIKITDKQACIDKCREEYDAKFPVKDISEENIQEAEYIDIDKESIEE